MRKWRGNGCAKSCYLRSLVERQDKNAAAPSFGPSRVPEPLQFKGSGLLGAQISPEEGQLLYTLLKLHGSRKVVELGTLFGHSTSWIASALPEDGTVWTFEKDHERAKIAASNLLPIFGETVKIIVGDALEELTKLSISKIGLFDAVFIDAKKLDYCRYLDWAEGNIRKGGLIVADNALLFDKIFDQEFCASQDCQQMREFNQRLTDPDKYDSSMVPTQEGLLIASKRF